MKPIPHVKIIWIGLAVALALVLTVAAAVSASGGAYSLDWFTIDGGGVVDSSASGYALSGAIGQPEANGSVAGGGYSLSGGFWAAAVEAEDGDSIYLPLLRR